jgi:hypothetical protein
MAKQSIAVASAVSFGDFVIAHSVLNRADEREKSWIRLIACSHLSDLNAILPHGVRVTIVDSGENRVPAVFDVKKCGALAAIQSAFSLRGRLQKVERDKAEVLAFHALGVRERFIAGGWPVVAPRERLANIYDTYTQFLTEQGIRLTQIPSPLAVMQRTVGIFPESRLPRKRLSEPALSVTIERAQRAGLDVKVFILDGDRAPQNNHAVIVNIPRNFKSLASAISSVDFVISADSLPAHLGEYLGRPVFVALSERNDYWLPHGCFTSERWGVFEFESKFAYSLDKFLTEAVSV